MSNKSVWKDEERCQAALADTIWHRKWTDMRCSYRQMFKVGKKLLCGRHASLELLHMAVKSKSVQVLSHPKPPHSAVDVVSANWKSK